MIAGVLKSPGRYSPYLDGEAALKRRDVVLTQMTAEGYITRRNPPRRQRPKIETKGLRERAATRARTSSSTSRPTSSTSTVPTRSTAADSTVDTTLDLKMQTAAEKAVNDALDKKGDPSAAVVAVEPKTGEILRDGGRARLRQAAVQRRGAGPTSAGLGVQAVRAGHRTGGGHLARGDVRERTGEAHGGRSDPWKVTGAGGGRRGPMRLREGDGAVGQLGVRAADHGGDAREGRRDRQEDGHRAQDHARAGHRARRSRGGRLAAGHGIGVRHARQRRHVTSSRTASSRCETDAARCSSGQAEEAQGVEPAIAALGDRHPEGRHHARDGQPPAIGRPAAGKTGTTQEYRDAWFVGYTPRPGGGGVGRLPGGTARDDERPRHQGDGRLVPREDLGRLHEGGTGRTRRRTSSRSPRGSTTISRLRRDGPAGARVLPQDAQGPLPRRRPPGPVRHTHGADGDQDAERRRHDQGSGNRHAQEAHRCSSRSSRRTCRRGNRHGRWPDAEGRQYRYDPDCRVTDRRSNGGGERQAAGRAFAVRVRTSPRQVRRSRSTRRASTDDRKIVAVGLGVRRRRQGRGSHRDAPLRAARDLRRHPLGDGRHGPGLLDPCDVVVK